MTVTDGTATFPVGIPAVYFGQVRSRKEADRAVGGTNYFNLDPCSGEWEVRILGNSSTGESSSKITDVEVSLLIATLPKV